VERVDLRREIQEVYLHSFLFKLGIKLVGIFLPFYILELGYGISEILVFFGIYTAAYILLTYFNAAICSKLGYKHTSLVASVPILLFYLLLRSAETKPEIFGLAFLGGLGFNLYWMGMNPEVARSSHDGEREKETGFFFSMPSLASVFSPIVGGMTLAIFDFKLLFTVSALMIAFSFLPFLFSREHYSGMELQLQEFLSSFSPTDFLTFAFEGFNSMGKKVFWPAYLALIIGGSLNIGGAGSFRALGSALTSVLIGKMVNSENRNRFLAGGFGIAAISYIAMSFVTQPVTAFAVSLLNGLSYTAGSIPIYSRALEHSEEKDYIEYFAVRELALAFGRISFLATGFLLFRSFSQSISFLIGFSLLAISVTATAYHGSKM